MAHRYDGKKWSILAIIMDHRDRGREGGSGPRPGRASKMVDLHGIVRCPFTARDHQRSSRWCDNGLLRVIAREEPDGVQALPVSSHHEILSVRDVTPGTSMPSVAIE